MPQPETTTGPSLAVQTASEPPADAEVVAVPVWQGEEPADVDPDELAAQGFEGKVGQTAQLGGRPARVAVGMGPRADVDLDVLRRAAAAVVRAAWRRRSVAAPLLDGDLAGIDQASATQAVAEGALLATYRFGRFKRDPKASDLQTFTLVGPSSDDVDRGLAHARAVSRGVFLARDLVNTPGGQLTPPELARVAEEVAGAAGLGVEVMDESRAGELRLGGLLGVGGGSDNPPRMVKLTYEPDGATTTLALVGKGITFDSGGLSLKTGEGMMTMKSDMSGAAAVLAAMSVLPTLGVPVRVIGFLCLAENMPSGTAIRPDDVLEIRNGTTVEVLNTDAEGRLVLADGLSLAAEDAPAAIVDLATLTGACKVALGPTIAGVMGNHDGLVDQVRSAAARAGESVWHLPLPQEYRSSLDSDVADLKNIGGRYGGALVAGLFLQEFVGSSPWAHLDIAGPAWVEEEAGYVPKGGTGFGVRTLVELVAAFDAPSGDGQAAGDAPVRAS